MAGVRFRTADGLTLEGEIREADGRARGTAVACHPHPRYGGSKDHPVLWAIRNELAGKRGLTVLAFNFRGVMGSEGEYGGGEPELSDVAAAIDRVRQDTEGPTVLVGWSFGAAVSLRHAVIDRRVAALALLGMPLGEARVRRLGLPSLGELGELTVPVLLVAGGADPFCPEPALRNLATWIPNAEVLVVEGTDHFFGHREREVAAGIGEFVDRALQ